MAAIIVLDVFLGIIALAGLIIVWNQLRAQLHKPGATGVVITIDRLTPRRKGIARVEVTLRMVGPAVRYEVALDLEADGNRFEASTPKPATRPSMGCDDEEVSWSVEIAENDLGGVWVIASWIDPHHARLRMAALAANLHTLETYEWKWAADWRLSAAGHWRRRRTPTTPPRTVPGMGPLELGRAPGRGLAQVAAEAVTETSEER
ncbi:hypothetical protein [Mycobacterium numidiamassiliense]|uniref:hypothetical protein n=1 Tax=Mycobacterium numidiamassiliense TaxID=1841861 RepID=UPI00097D077B|nr:hypothetical protein [Mycobacterium numidiamassiliense]